MNGATTPPQSPKQCINFHNRAPTLLLILAGDEEEHDAGQGVESDELYPFQPG
jgi:hypothetical protein